MYYVNKFSKICINTIIWYKLNFSILRARSFGIFRNKNVFWNILRLFCSWEQNSQNGIQVFRNENSSQTNAYLPYSNYSYSGLIPNECALSNLRYTHLLELQQLATSRSKCRIQLLWPLGQLTKISANWPLAFKSFRIVTNQNEHISVALVCNEQLDTRRICWIILG